MKKRCFSLLTGVCAIVLMDVQSASAFYWQNWPGSGTTTTPTTSSGSTVVPTTPSTPSTPIVTPPDVDDSGEPVDPLPPDDPNTVHAPEPATLVGGLIGLGVLAVARLRRKSRPLAP